MWHATEKNKKDQQIKSTFSFYLQLIVIIETILGFVFIRVISGPFSIFFIKHEIVEKEVLYNDFGFFKKHIGEERQKERKKERKKEKKRKNRTEAAVVLFTPPESIRRLSLIPIYPNLKLFPWNEDHPKSVRFRYVVVASWTIGFDRKRTDKSSKSTKKTKPKKKLKVAAFLRFVVHSRGSNQR